MTAATADHDVPTQAPPQRGTVRRLLLGPGWIRAVWMTALFASIGFGIVVVLRWWGGWHPILDWTAIVTVELISTPFGFMIGLGCFDYWFH